jgi:transcriptional regulator with GAF, ATPase, and Fis domain
MAQSIHRLSNRNKGPYVSINCSALSESLFESELFGHVKGSFTGATGDRKGAFESARGGSLFLDEIGDLPMSLQPKLLRALENREIQAVGSDRPIKTDVRVIAATHQNLKSLVKSGHFREDLFYRLYVVHLQVPGLNQRMEDFEDILYRFAKEYRVRFSHAAILALKKHSWPGHIRELKNTVARSRALFMSQEIQESDVPAIVDALNTDVSPNTPIVSGSSRSARNRRWSSR